MKLFKLSLSLMLVAGITACGSDIRDINANNKEDVKAAATEAKDSPKVDTTKVGGTEIATTEGTKKVVVETVNGQKASIEEGVVKILSDMEKVITLPDARKVKLSHDFPIAEDGSITHDLIKSINYNTDKVEVVDEDGKSLGKRTRYFFLVELYSKAIGMDYTSTELVSSKSFSKKIEKTSSEEGWDYSLLDQNFKKIKSNEEGKKISVIKSKFGSTEVNFSAELL